MTGVPRSLVLVLSLTLAGASALADPLPVHVPPAAGRARPTTAERLQIADAVADVLSDHLREVLSGTETRARLETLAPDAVRCAEARCAARVGAALRARGVVLVTVTPGSRGQRVHLALDAVNLRGEVVAHADGDEVVADQADAIALGRAVATELVPTLRPLEPTPVVPAPAVGNGGASDGGAAPSAGTPARGAAPPPPARMVNVRVAHRRPVEALLGGGLIVGGGVALALGVEAIASDGDVVGDPCDATNAPERACEERRATAASYVAVGVGVAAVLGGAYLLWDGLRPRYTYHLRPASLRLDATPLARGGGLVTLAGAF